MLQKNQEKLGAAEFSQGNAAGILPQLAQLPKASEFLEDNSACLVMTKLSSKLLKKVNNASGILQQLLKAMEFFGSRQSLFLALRAGTLWHNFFAKNS